MSRKVLHIAFLSAWLVAAGGVWDLMQVAAWANMFSSNLQTMSVGDAARQTFLPEEKCKLCLLVEDGKSAQDDSPGAVGGEVSKAPIVFQTMARISVTPPEGESRVRVKSNVASYRREVPPLPPPRA